MSKNHEFFTFGRQVIYVFASYVISSFLGFLTMLILTNGLGPKLYGIWSLINVGINLIVPFAVLSLGMAIIRFLAAEQDKAKVRDDFISICFVVFVTGTILSVLFFFLAEPIAVFIFKDRVASFYIKIASILIILNSINIIAFSFFRMRRMIGLYTTLNIAKNVVEVILITFMVLTGNKLVEVIYMMVITALLFDLIGLSLVVRTTGLQIPRFSRIKSYLKWGVPLTPSSTMLWIINVSDRYMVSFFLSVSSAGIYSAAYNIGHYASFALSPIYVVLYPNIIKAYDEGNLEQAKN